MSCGNGCGCCAKCGCRATCTCNHSMGFKEGMGNTFSYSVAIMEPGNDDGTIRCGPYCGNSESNGICIGYLSGDCLSTANIG